MRLGLFCECRDHFRWVCRFIISILVRSIILSYDPQDAQPREQYDTVKNQVPPYGR